MALAQARAFMRARKVGIAGYRQQLAASPAQGAGVAAAKTPATRSRWPQAWQASLDRGRRDCPAARELLQLLAFLAPDAIPRDLLGAKPEALPEAVARPVRPRRRDRGAGRFSLLRVEPDRLTVHRLVQAVTRDGLDERDGAARAEAAVALVDAALPPPTLGQCPSAGDRRCCCRMPSRRPRRRSGSGSAWKWRWELS